MPNRDITDEDAKIYWPLDRQIIEECAAKHAVLAAAYRAEHNLGNDNGVLGLAK